MIIYNVTIKPDWSIHEDWLQWMKEEHMQQVVDTGCFSSYKLLRLLEVDETDGPTYAAQYTAGSMEQYQDYISKHASRLRDEGFSRWGNKFIAFRSIMQVVH